MSSSGKSTTTQLNQTHHQIKQVLELAVLAGEILLRSGAEVARIEETISLIIRSFGFDSSYNIVMPTGFYVSIDSDNDDTDDGLYPVTLVRRVRTRLLNYSRISAVNDLSRRIAQGAVTLEQARRELDRINRAPDPYPYALRLLAGTGSACSTTLLLGGSLLDILPAAIGTTLTLLLIWLLGRSRIPAIFGEFFGAVMATMLTLLAVWLKLGIDPSLAIAGGIIQLVPGSAIVASVQDGISGDLISSAARGLEALLKGGAIAGGVGLGLAAGVNLGIIIPLSQNATVFTWQIPIQVIAAGLAAAGYAVYNHTPRFAIFTAGLNGSVGWLTHIFITNILNGDGLLATFLASFIAGIFSWRLARLQHAPATLYMLPAILPLLPGLSIYNAMLNLTQNQNVTGLLLLARAIFIGGAIAAGIALSNSLSQSVHIHRKVNRKTP